MAQHQQEIRNLFVRTAIEHLLRITEAVFSPEQSFLWAVQWHPELSFEKDENSRLIFERFVQSCSC